MKNILIALMVVMSFTGCEEVWNCTDGEGPIVTQKLNLSDFNSIELHGSGKVYISQGEEQEVLVEGQNNIINELNTHISNGHWDIKFRDCTRDHRELVFYLTVPDITKIEVSGSGEIRLEDILLTDHLELEVEGSGGISGSVEVISLDMEITGSGGISLSGEASDASLEISGSGKLSAYSLEADSYDIRISGSGNADITAIENLDVEIAGSGSVNYKGNPTINSNISGSGKIINRN